MRGQQTGLCFLDGCLIVGLYEAQKEIRDSTARVGRKKDTGEKPTIVSADGTTITLVDEHNEEEDGPEGQANCVVPGDRIPRIYERIGARLHVYRKNGVQIITTKRTALHVSPRRIRRMEREHRVRFDFVPHTDVPPTWFQMTKKERLDIACKMARGVKFGGAFTATNDDLPRELLTTARLLPDRKPSPTVRTPAPRDEGATFGRILLGCIGLVSLAVLPFALLRGIEAGFGGGAAVLASYGVLGYAMIYNWRKRAAVNREAW